MQGSKKKVVEKQINFFNGRGTTMVVLRLKNDLERS